MNTINIQENKKSFLTKNFYIFIIFYIATVSLSNDMFLPAIQDISSSLHSGIESMQLSLTSWGVGALVMQIFAGAISDSIGRKKVIIGIGIMMILGTLGCIFAYSGTSFIVAHFFEGLAGGAGVVAIASILDYYDEKKSVTVISIATNVMMLTTIAGPFIGSGVLFLADWRYIFILDLAVFVVALIALVIYMPETLHVDKRAENQGLLTPIKSMCNVSRDIPFLLYAVSGGCAMFLMMMWITCAPVLLITNNGLSSSEYAFYQSPIIIMSLFGNVLAGQLMKSVEIKKMLNSIHALLLIVGIIAVFVGIFIDISMNGVLVGFSIFSFIVSLLNAPKMSYALRLPKNNVGTASSFYGFIGLGIGLLASVFATTFTNKPSGDLIVVAGVCAVVAFIIAYIADIMIAKRAVHIV